MNILQIALLLIDLVKVVEELMPDGGQGEAKLRAVREMAEKITGSLEENWSTLAKFISVIVAIYNKMGIFKK